MSHKNESDLLQVKSSSADRRKLIKLETQIGNLNKRINRTIVVVVILCLILIMLLFPIMALILPTLLYLLAVRTWMKYCSVDLKSRGKLGKKLFLSGLIASMLLGFLFYFLVPSVI